MFDKKFPRRPFPEIVYIDGKQHKITGQLVYTVVAGDYKKDFPTYEEAVIYLDEQTKWVYKGTRIIDKRDKK